MKLSFLIDVHLRLAIMLWQVQSCRAVYALRYRSDVAQFYMRLKSNYRVHSDPLQNATRQQRIALCDLVLSANTFICRANDAFLETRNRYLNADMSVYNYQVSGYNANLPEDRQGILNYHERLVFIPNVAAPIKIKMFACSVDDNMELFLTYGFKMNYLFILVKTPDDYYGTRMSRPVPLQIWSLIETIPRFYQISATIHDSFWNYIEQAYTISTTSFQSYLTETFNSDTSSLSFVTVVPREGASLSNLQPSPVNVLNAPRNTELYFLSKHQHFRLCASIANVLNKYPEFLLDIGRQNIVYPITIIPRLMKRIIKDDQSLITHASPLPCAVNQHWTKPQFYVLNDPNCLGAVYILRPVQHRTYGNLLKLEGTMDNVMALYDA